MIYIYSRNIAMNDQDRYLKIHFGLGAVSAFDKTHTMDIVFITYQFGQLLLNKKIFIPEGRIENGNDLPHTLKKVGTYILAKTIAQYYANYFGK